MDSQDIPVLLRVRLAHAVVQAIADECGADLLHIKGPAVDASLLAPAAGDRPQVRYSTDADILVRPAHVRPMMAGLERHGWDVAARFATGSIFEHAATLWHQYLGYVDVHRHYPGITIDPDAAFERLWAAREVRAIGGRPCAVPSVPAQRLLLVLHAARSNGGANRPDVRQAWESATSEQQDEVRALVHELAAQVGFAAGTGHLDDFADDPSYELWAGFAGDTVRDPVKEWRARFKAADSPLQALRIVGRSLLVNTDHLAMRLGHRPSAAELTGEYVRRAGLGLERARRLVTQRWRKDRP